MTMVLCLDVETTTFQKGNPFSRRNKLCYVGIQEDDDYYDASIEYGNDPYGFKLATIENSISRASLIVGFNLKFDLHWIKNYVADVEYSCGVWDCQLAEFILSHQRWPYPDLDESCFRRGLGRKLDVVRTDYWEHGVDTPDVPEGLLRDYLKRDVTLTRQLYELQLTEFQKGDPRLFNLFRLQCADLLILLEMERNGMVYDTERSLELAEQCRITIDDIDQHLNELVDYDVPNWNSTDLQSAVLYGGSFSFPVRVETQRTLKDGSIKLGERNGWQTKEFPRLVEPLERTETKPTSEWSDDDFIQNNRGREKPFFRVFSVGEPVLKSLRGSKGFTRIKGLLLERANLNKLESTYYRGLPEMMEEMDWEPNMIHGQLNQCVAVTGRLSASRPNQQNFSGEIKPLFKSRYED